VKIIKKTVLQVQLFGNFFQSFNTPFFYFKIFILIFKVFFMKTFTKILFYAILINSLTGCRPLSKEAYLKQYNDFMTNVSNNGSKFKENDWKKKDAEFKKYNEVWYAYFKDELTFQEKVITTKNSFQYSFYRNQTAMDDFFKNYLKGNYEEVKKKLKYYKDNKMDSDIQSLIERSKEVGDGAEIKINEILEELEKK
jgi:hypothetical protein